MFAGFGSPIETIGVKVQLKLYPLRFPYSGGKVTTKE